MRHLRPLRVPPGSPLLDVGGSPSYKTSLRGCVRVSALCSAWPCAAFIRSCHCSALIQSLMLHLSILHVGRTSNHQTRTLLLAALSVICISQEVSRCQFFKHRIVHPSFSSHFYTLFEEQPCKLQSMTWCELVHNPKREFKEFNDSSYPIIPGSSPDFEGLDSCGYSKSQRHYLAAAAGKTRHGPHSVPSIASFSISGSI